MALPTITARFGADAWAAIAAGQASGAIAATVLELGWGWNGPMRVARASERNRRRYLVLALLSRSLIFVPLSLGAALVALLSTSEFAVTAALVAVGATLMGLSSIWFFIGIGNPWRAIANDSVPRAAGVLLATLLMAVLGAPLWTYPLVGLVLPGVATTLLPLVAARVRRSDFDGYNIRRASRVIAAQRSAVGARFISSLYMQAPILMVSWLAPVSTAALFAAGDRLARMALSGLAFVPNACQRWVGSAATQEQRTQRAMLATWGNVVFGVVAGTLFAILAPPVSGIIFSGTATLSLTQGASLGLLIAIVCSSRATGNILLVAKRAPRRLLISTIAGALLGFIAVPVLTLNYGVDGAFIALSVAEGSVLLTQILTLRSRIR